MRARKHAYFDVDLADLVELASSGRRRSFSISSGRFVLQSDRTDRRLPSSAPRRGLERFHLGLIHTAVAVDLLVFLVFIASESSARIAFEIWSYKGWLMAGVS